MAREGWQQKLIQIVGQIWNSSVKTEQPKWPGRKLSKLIKKTLQIFKQNQRKQKPQKHKFKFI